MYDEQIQEYRMRIAEKANGTVQYKDTVEEGRK